MDLRKCDVVLLEFQIRAFREVTADFDLNNFSLESECTRVPVRSPARPPDSRELCIPNAVNQTVTIVERQGWDAKVGVRIGFNDGSTRLKPNQQEIASVLDWLLTLSITMQTVVIEIDLADRIIPDLEAISRLYGSRFILKPGLTSSSLSEIMQSRGLHVDLTTGLTDTQASAEETLQKIGLLVSQHGAFLDLNTVYAATGKDCEKPNLDIWRTGEYSEDNPLTLDLDTGRLEMTGLYVFDELSRRSNNRAGIIVSLPTSAYVLESGCVGVPGLTNRYSGMPSNKFVYSTNELVAIVSDMAKWGVSRYCMGYLDYTFGRANSIPMFTALANTIDTAAESFSTLHYRYTRHSAFGDGGYSYAQVNGIYKLESGMFFQQVTDTTDEVKSFVSVPGVPGLRLGLSSDMNVGSPLPISKFSMNNLP